MSKRFFIVTGASRGLGESICKQLSELRHTVLAVARNESRLKELWEKNERVEWMTADLADPSAPEQIVARARELSPEIHGLVNNAGVIEPIAPLKECDAARWANVIQVNLTAPSVLMLKLLPHLPPQGGRIVNISSGAAVKVMEGWSAYCTSKAGFLHLTKIAAAENPSVAFFSLRPGVIDTRMQSEIRDTEGMREEDQAKFLQLKAEGNLEPPEVPARAAVWLLLHGPLDRSGEFIQYTDAQVAEGVEDLF